MKEQVHEVVPTGTHPEKLHVKHVRKPRERVPVALVSAAEGPAEIVQGHAASNMRVVNDIKAVIELDETVVQHCTEGGESGQGQKDAKERGTPGLADGLHQKQEFRWVRY